MRWNRRLLLGAIAVLVPALAGCEAGYNAPTLQFHPASSGVSTTVNGITLDNLFVLGPRSARRCRPAAGPGSSSRSSPRTVTGWFRSAPRAPRPR